MLYKVTRNGYITLETSTVMW